MFYILLFLFFYVVCLAVKDRKESIRRTFLQVACIVLTLFIGLRKFWPDQRVYEIAFEIAPMPWDFTWDIQPYGYAEKGYLFLASLVKVVYDEPVFYCLAMGAISMYLLYKNLNKYCIIPLIGLCDYIARFLLNRDFTQMRSSLAILLIIGASKYIVERKPLQYFLWVLLAYQFHHMALIAIPMYFFYLLNLTNRKIIIGLILAFILSQTLAGQISDTVELYSQDLNYETYTEGSYVDQALGLKNPMIYYQIAILLLFTFGEDKLKHLSKYYSVFRSGYFYSTLILIFFCNYTALSGRTSTMFATYEMFILPMLAYSFNKKGRWLFYMIVGFILLYFFQAKYFSAMSMINDSMNIMN